MSAEALLTFVVGSLVGVIKVPIFQWIKEKLGLEGPLAFLVLFLFSIALAVIALAVTGSFVPFDWERMFEYLGAIVAMGQFTYQLFFAE